LCKKMYGSANVKPGGTGRQKNMSRKVFYTDIDRTTRPATL